MTFELNPLALSSAPILRLIDRATEHEIASIKGLAQAVGRDDSNVGKSLKALEAAGLVNPDPLMNGLTPDGQAQLAALDRAADQFAVGAITALHGDLEPHPLNPRKDFDSDAAIAALDELRESILLRQLMQPIVVRPRPFDPTGGRQLWWIVDGERRWRAIGQAVWDGDWPEDQPIPIVPRAVDDREHLLLSLTANLQRADMSAIEEAVSFNAAVHDFGITTEALANELGKSQRYVQQRIALLKLSDEDQDRMRLPSDHPDRLTFKAARSLTQTAREPAADDRLPPSQEFSAMAAEYLPQRGEPGSPPDQDASEQTVAQSGVQADPPSFGSTLTDRQALMLVEVADKADREPDADLGSEHYTGVQSTATQGNSQDLVTKGLIGFRQRGMTVLIRPRLFSTGLKEWLEEIGFYGPHRTDVLFEMRARVHGTDLAAQLAQTNTFATAWLNSAGSPPSLPDGSQPSASGSGAALAREQLEAEVEQPELIEASEEEKAQRRAAEDERNADARARNAADQFARIIGDWTAFARCRGARDYLNPSLDAGPSLSPEDMAVALIKAVVMGRVGESATLLAALSIRAGAMGAPRTLEQMPESLIVQVIGEARNPAPPADEDAPAEEGDAA